MKTIQIVVSSLLILLSINTVSAQYGNGGYGGGGYGNNGYGGNGGYGNGYGGSGRMSQMNQGNQGTPEKPKETPPEEIVSKLMVDMKPYINLDDLQEIAISNVLIESIKTQGRIIKQVTNQDEQIKDFQALAEITDRKIIELLSKEQKDKYLSFKDEQKKPRKSRSKDKK